MKRKNVTCEKCNEHDKIRHSEAKILYTNDKTMQEYEVLDWECNVCGHQFSTLTEKR